MEEDIPMRALTVEEEEFLDKAVHLYMVLHSILNDNYEYMSSKEFLDTVHDPEGSVITHIKNVASDMVKSIEKMEAEVKEVELKEVESEKIEGNE